MKTSEINIIAKEINIRYRLVKCRAVVKRADTILEIENLVSQLAHSFRIDKLADDLQIEMFKRIALK